MVDQNCPSRPLSPYERQQAQLRDAYETKQADIAERKEQLLSQHGDRFERVMEIRSVEDEETRKLATDNLATDLAERNITRPDLMDWQDYTRAADQAIGKAYKTEELQRQQEAQNPNPEPAGGAPEKASAQPFEPATPAREAERDPQQQQVQTPDRQAEATPERSQERDPGRRPIGHYDELKQQHAEIVAKAPPTQEEPETQEQQPERKKLHFRGDAEREQNETREHESDKSSKEQEEPGRKKLSFFSDRNPFPRPRLQALNAPFSRHEPSCEDASSAEKYAFN